MTAPLRVIVVGAGPGGISAAAIAAENGCQVRLLDENPAPGGQIWRGYKADTASSYSHDREFAKWLGRFEKSGALWEPESSVIDSPAPGVLRVERAGDWHDLAWDRLVIAAGARERFLPFPGWTLPGVMGAGGLQAMVKSGLTIARKRVVIAGSGPLLLAVAANLRREGAKIEGVFEQAPLGRLAAFAASLAALPGKLVEGARYRWQTRRVPYKPGWWVKCATGESRLQGVVVSNGSDQREMACDYLACGFHLVPNLELAQLLGCRIEARFVSVNAVQETSIRGVYCVGEPTGIGGLDKALVEGQIAGFAVAGHLGKAAEFLPSRQKLGRFAQLLDKTFAPRAELRALATANTIICRCEDITHGELADCASGRAARLHTRCGMGPCQGRICGAATEFLFGWTAASARPPIYPARLATLAGQSEKELSPTDFA